MSINTAELQALSIGFSWRERARRIRRLTIEALALLVATFSEMPFLDHLEELRSRILKCLAAIGVALVICLSYTAPLIVFAERPVRGIPEIQLISNELTEVFAVYFKVGLVGAICLAAPVILWQIWQFVAPGLYKNERRYAGPFVLSTTISFIAGAVFAYKVLLPVSLKLSAIMAKPIVAQQNLTVSSYLDSLSWMVLSMGLVFELPAVIFILSRIGLVTAGFLARHFRYALLLAAIVGAVATPSTDVPTMLFVAVPIIALYAVSILVALIFGRKRQIEA